MNKISGGQLAALLLISDAFTLICLKGSITLITSAAFLVSAAVQLAMALPAVSYYKNGGALKSIPKPFLWFYLVYIIIWGGLLFVMLWNTSDELSIPSENFPIIPEKLLISGLIALICLYASSPGLRALSRASVIASALGAVCIAIFIIGTISRFSFKNLTDIPLSESFFTELSRSFILSGGLGSFVILLGYTKKSPLKSTVGYFIGKAVLYTAVTVMTTAAAGGIMEISDFPVIMAAEISQPFSSQRIDSVFLMIFVISAIFAIAVQTAAASCLFGELFPNFTKLRSTLSLILMIGGAFILPEAGSMDIFYSTSVIAALFAVPILIKLCRPSRRRQ